MVGTIKGVYNFYADAGSSAFKQSSFNYPIYEVDCI